MFVQVTQSSLSGSKEPKRSLIFFPPELTIWFHKLMHDARIRLVGDTYQEASFILLIRTAACLGMLRKVAA